MPSLWAAGAAVFTALIAAGVAHRTTEHDVGPVPLPVAQSQTAAPLDGPASAALTSAQDQTPACPPPRVETLPRRGGLTEIVVNSECRRFETVRIKYAQVEFLRTIDEGGQLNFVLDCFAGEASTIELIFADGSQLAKRVTTFDLARVTKVAVIWTAPVNLDLHAFEYSARPESHDHIWQGYPLSPREARQKADEAGRGHGFLSTMSVGTEAGAKVEVYTFFHHPAQKRGVINMALDYESRSRPERSIDTCGMGLYAELEYEAILLEPNGQPERLFREFAPLDCSKKLTGINRLNHKTVPEIVIRN